MTQSVSKGLPGFLLLIWLYLRARRRESRWVEHVLSPETASGAATPDEIEALLTFHGRRHERRAAKRLAGASGARRTKELQRQQIGLAVALTRSAGSTTPEIEQRRQAIASLREKIRAAAAAQGRRGGRRS
jgi:hypothetical protein